MPTAIRELKDLVTIQRRTEIAPGQWSETAFTDVCTVAASVTPEGDERYRIRIRYRAELRSRSDVAPMDMRVVWRGQPLDVNDAIETERRRFVDLIATARLVEVTDLSGAHRTQRWP